MVTHASPGDSFWTVVQNGAEAAAKDLGVKLSYQASGGDVQKQVQMINLRRGSQARGPDYHTG